MGLTSSSASPSVLTKFIKSTIMRRILLVIVLVLCGSFTRLFADNIKVTLKSGVTITGDLKELVTTDHITLIIGGVESIISMDEVSSIEQMSSSQASTQGVKPSKLVYGQYQITDTKQYPDSFILEIGGQELTMVLVKGGWFNMGYDGRHSLSWNTEPIHKVTLSSFYVSKQVLNRHAAETLLKKKKISDSVKPYSCKYRQDAEEMIEIIRELFGAPYRMLTEAEWEYTTLMPFADAIFEENNNNEWCSDYWEKYPAADQINPKGPSSGKSHVLRSYSSGNNKWKRMKGDNATQKKEYSFNSDAFLRIAISADQIQ